MTRAVFFDRDGVLNLDCGYLFEVDKFVWQTGAKEIIGWLNDNGWLVIVVTNQSGVARGYYTEEDVMKLHQWMNEQLAVCGAHIDAFYHCPHLLAGKIRKYSIECDCRKPAPGMLLAAITDYGIDCSQSFMVGDKPGDLTAAKAAGVQGWLFEGGDLSLMVKDIVASLS